MLKRVTAGANCPGGILLEKGRAMGNTVAVEVANMLAAAWLMLSSLFYSLQLSSGSFPRPLTEEEERYYLDLAGKGDLEARNVLIERNLRLVAHIMKKYYAQTADQEDLISIGTIGLIKGITTFDASKGARLATYAARCVENEILMYLRRNSKTKMEVSIDEPLNVDWDGNELLLSDILGTDDDVISRRLEDEVEIALLGKAISKLTKREQMIIRLRFGIGNREGSEKTQKEVADLLGISQSYISRLEKRIMKRLRKEIVKYE